MSATRVGGNLTAALSAVVCMLGVPPGGTGSPTAAERRHVALPEPTGEHAVGTTIFEWVDESREELWTPDPSDRRRLAVQIWYPASPPPGARPAPYVPGGERIQASLDAFWPTMPVVRTHAVLDAPLSRALPRYPLLVFSHGMNTSRWSYSALLEELASHGFVVAAIDHAYWGPGVAFANGPPVRFEDCMVARDRLGPDEIDRMMALGIEVMADDEAFVARKVLDLSRSSAEDRRFAGRLDSDRVGVIGHSMGAMAAARAARLHAVFRACASLEGDGVNLVLPDSPPWPGRKPFLLITDAGWPWGPDRFRAPATGDTALFARRFLAAWEHPIAVTIRGARHNSFSDLPLLSATAPDSGEIDRLRAHRIVGAYCVAFFDRFLNGRASPLLDGPTAEFPEVVIQDLRSFADPAR